MYVGAEKAAKLSIIRVNAKGQPTVVAAAATPQGARNPVVDATGTAYLANPLNGGLFVVAFKP